MSNFLIVTGLIILFLGLIIKISPDFNLPLLPGDILIKKENFVFYLPIVSSFIISLILIIIFNLFK